MGQLLSSPKTEKDSSMQTTDKMVVGMSSMQGWRISMEDAHTIAPKLHNPKSGTDDLAFFAVFDGHGGHIVAQYAGENIVKTLQATEEFKQGEYETALIETYLRMDRQLLSLPEFKGVQCGCTAVSCLVTQSQIFCANAGDSRCILSVDGQAYAMSVDHKPYLPEETKRIKDAGGFVDFNRVNGNLALSRAIGDFEFKNNQGLPPEKQIVTVFPEVTKYELNESVDYMVIACDGIWDCMQNFEVIEFINQRIAEGADVKATCEKLLDHCLSPAAFAGAFGTDNMSVIIVGFLHGKTVEEWVQKITRNHQQSKSTPNTLVAVNSPLSPSSSDSQRAEHDSDGSSGDEKEPVQLSANHKTDNGSTDSGYIGDGGNVDTSSGSSGGDQMDIEEKSSSNNTAADGDRVSKS
ncbi:hypothetical protein MIR68_009568 [Amoeboaphelidium protococcarum]|nr:hypothetical protein MIR68_009568 [Amoeboaphelidium protococcarum]